LLAFRTHRAGLIQPPITAVLARLVLGEPLGIRGAMGCLVSLAGVVFIW
jgi:drug/metabolite transporter (DMT)-like permease